MNFLVTILSLGIVVLIHELGHFLFARLSGVRVYEFSIGLGPQLFSISYRDTVYSIRVLPLGGFVKLAGMDEDYDGPVHEDEDYTKKSFLSKFSIIAAGPIMNIFLTYILFVFIFFQTGKMELVPKIEMVLDGSPAYHAGLTVGDELMSLNGRKIENVEKDMISVVAHSGFVEHHLIVNRGGELLSFDLVPEQREGQLSPKVGIQLAQVQKDLSFFEAAGVSVEYLGKSVTLVFDNLKFIFSKQFSLTYLSGPVGIVQVASQVYRSGWIPFLNLVAFISLMVGIVNLLPIPVFDGGHLFFLCLEKLRGKPLSKKVALLINNISIAFLLTLMLVVIINDIVMWKERLEAFKGLIDYDQN